MQSNTTTQSVSNQTAPRQQRQSGFSLVEMLTALLLVGILGVIAGGFVLPLKLNRSSSNETTALSYARSYLELVKNKWLDTNDFQNLSYPTIGGTLDSTVNWVATGAINNSAPQIVVPSDWKVAVACKNSGVSIATACASSDELRTVTIQLTAPKQSPFTLAVQISRP